MSLSFLNRTRLEDGSRSGLEVQARWPGRTSVALGPGLDATPLAADAVGIVLASACRHGAAQPETGVMSVTVPDWFAASSALLEAAALALEESGLPPERLEIAIGEAGLDEHCTDTLLALSALRDLGVGVAMEGFGRRTASLLTLKRLPLSAVKLDCGLVADSTYDSGARALISAASGFAHSLDMQVIAAAPDDALKAVLRHLGCDEIVERARDRTVVRAVEALDVAVAAW